MSGERQAFGYINLDELCYFCLKTVTKTDGKNREEIINKFMMNQKSSEGEK